MSLGGTGLISWDGLGIVTRVAKSWLGQTTKPSASLTRLRARLCEWREAMA